MADKKWTYFFGNGNAEGKGDMKALLGGKGAGLAEMTGLGLPVPAGFTVTTEACSWFFEHDRQWPEGLDTQIHEAVARLESETGKAFGDVAAPLLVSVRSGAAVSMPGMMDTVLNLGLNDETVVALANNSGNAKFAWDSYRRFVQMFGDVVLGIHFTRFSKAQEAFCGDRRVEDLNAAELETLTGELKSVIAQAGHDFPQDPREQLTLAINAVFNSYNSHRARYYRKTQRYPRYCGYRGECSGHGVWKHGRGLCDRCCVYS